MSTLLPCPFCGNEPAEYAIEAHSHSEPLKSLGFPDHKGSHCIECGCGAGLIDDTSEKVFARWNTRASINYDDIKPSTCIGDPNSCETNEGYGCYCTDKGLIKSGEAK